MALLLSVEETEPSTATPGTPPPGIRVSDSRDEAQLTGLPIGILRRNLSATLRASLSRPPKVEMD